MSGGVQTHLGAGYIHIRPRYPGFGLCNGHWRSFQAQNVHNMGPKCVFASFIFREKDGLGQGQIKKKKKQAVLPAIATMCT